MVVGTVADPDRVAVSDRRNALSRTQIGGARTMHREHRHGLQLCDPTVVHFPNRRLYLGEGQKE